VTAYGWPFSTTTHDPEQEMTPSVRPVCANDRAEWLRMRDALWPGLATGLHHAEMELYTREPGRKAVFVLDRGDGGLGGFLEAATRGVAEGCASSPVGYIEGWYVDANLRRRGFGAALVAAAEAWARSIGCREMASDCELSNTVSFRAHAALGYAEVLRLVHFRKPLPPGTPEPQNPPDAHHR
jgi:aminoglycoside 6'-N-acetyltransferase I